MALCSAAAAPVLAQTQVINSARVTVPVGVVDTNPDNNDASATVRVVVPNLSIAKSGPATAVVGTAYNYVLTVTNNGTAPTTNIATVADTVPAGLTINSAAGCSISGQNVSCQVSAGLTNVAPGNTVSFTINVTPAASAAPSVSNTAVVTGGGDPDCVGTGCTTPPVVTTVRPTIDAVNDSYNVPAAGGTTASVIANDTTNNVAAVIGTNVTLTPGAAPVPAVGSITMNANGTITVVANTAAGSYSYPYQICTIPATVPVTCDSAVATVVVASAPGLTIVKTAGTPTGSTAGSTIAYSFLVTNTGNVTITGIVVNDAQLDAAAVCPVTTLAPGEDTTCTGTHTITQAEVNAGVVNNSATATGTPPTGPSVTSPPDTTSTPIASAPGLTIVKTAGTPTGSTAGSTIAYSFLVTNTGNVTITGIVVNDAQLDAAAVCPVTTLAPGEDTTCTGTHTITQAEVNAGVVNNSATATGTPPTGPSVTSPPDTTSTPITQTPGQSLVKALTGDSTGGAVAVGDELTYTITLSNTGNTTLTGVVVNDALITPSSISCASVAPGATCQLVGTYTVTQADADAGNIRNTAVVSSPACPAGSTNAGCTTTINTPVPQTPDQSLVKALTGDSTGGAVAVGDELTYTITLSNTGNTTLTGVVVNDALITPSSISCASVAPGATCQLVGTYTVTQADADAGNIRNTAVVSSPACPAGSTNAGCTTTIDTPVQNPAVTFSKSVVLPVGQTEVSVGDTLTYNLQVVVGDAATTSPVTLTDTLGQGLTLGTVTAGSLSCGVGNPLVCTLPANTAPGTYLVTYTAIVNELATGFVRNVVVATGDDAPTCQGACQTETIVTEPLPAIVSYGKSAVLPAGKTRVVAGDVITYTLTATVAAAPTSSVITLTDTLGTGLTFGAVTAAGAYTCGATSPLVCTLPEGTVPGVYTVTYTATVNGQASGVVRNAVVGTGTDNPVCANECDVETPVATPTVVVNKSSDPANGATVQPGQVITYTLSVQVGQAALDSAVTLVDTPDRGLTLGAMPAGCAYNGTTMTCIVPAGTPVGTQTFTYTATVNASVTGRVTNVVVANSADPTDPPPTCQTCSTEHLVGLPEIRLSKSAGVREVRIGDLVRYTLTVENVGSTDLVNGSIVDTPAAGFSYVEGSLLAADADRMVTVTGNRPLRFAGVDVRAGETATLVYVLRVGAGVRPGAHVNQAQVRSSIDEPVSNVATAEVLLTADAMLDDSLLVGTVFNDRDGDGWQDSATLGGVKVQGGFAPGAYIANSTTVDHGAGPQPEPDASSPMLHGIAVGTISGRQSPADPVDAHEVVIRQRLSELAFTDDFVLTSDQGVTVRMDAAGNTRVEQSGDAAKGLTAAAPTVERRVAQGEGGYVVDYVIRNTGIDERGIPGVRIASVEGLLIETDQYGRYHLAGVSGGAWERGRNFILKVDPSTLPSGAEFTTDNPLLRRITPGVPVRFDFGVKLPEQVIEDGSEQVELELGEVFFAPGSAEVRAQYRPVIEAMAAQVRKHGGGEVVISANGDAEALAFERANAVKAALLETLEPAVAQALVVSARGNVDDPGSLVVGVDEGGALLGTVLFDTDKAAIRPEFEPLLDKVAAALEKRGGGSIAIVGHTDVRGSHAYNTALGMRRAKAVYEALAKRLSPEVRAHVRVESSNDPTAPVGVRK
ncbi:DUF7507 domain-containing protein [Pseudoxanthomonas japonensis]|uniref:DUF7507 domain-containing protein n=1 Tax=Pseudoxanthomonas japonensis TaxID=69284 RepID=UPI0013913414|nr:OmpA family protein [Pseudoxanthomonas japonensis]